ncbi:MAG TPA: hypothetical protein VNI77_03090, partial [Nitrososphaera sp.]|nr:hypothetical protein [Nitrososphaera sp.]
MRISTYPLKSLFIVLCLTSYESLFAQPLFTESFNYEAGSSLETQGGWSNAEGTGTITVANSGLTYSTYAGNSGTDKAATIGQGSKILYNTLLSGVSSGSIYISFMVKVASSSNTSGDNFFFISDVFSPPLQGKFARVYVRENTGKVQFGISWGANHTIAWTGDYDMGQTHLLTVKWTFGGQAAKLFLNDLSDSEPTNATATTTDNLGNDPVDPIQYIQIAQTAPTTGAVLDIDGIRVATSWSDAPLPVQLTAFTAVANRLSAELRWSTATEVNNHGFEIERRTVQRSEVGGQISAGEWARVGFVPGAGTSTSPREYTFIDAGLEPGRYAYRIKQVDNDGAFTYYSAAEVEIGAAPKAFTLHPNYPNPFNPSTSIEFTIPEDGFATLKVFNLLGQEVATL